MICTATHDTKLGEDVRARINVLSELPDDWAREVALWMRANRDYRTVVDGEPAPDRNDEYRFYQALIGIWPPDLPARRAARARSRVVERLQAYMIKAVKEAKLHTSWLTPNQDYENAVTTFVESVLTDPPVPRVVPALSVADRGVGHGQLAGPGHAEAGIARRSRTSIRVRSCGI